MRVNRNVPFARLRGDRRGMALPVALFGLVAVTILVTSALMTSTTEAAMSSANLDATRALYTAEGAVQAYVASRGAELDSVRNLDWQIPGTTQRARITVTRLGRLPGDITANPPFGPTDRYSVLAEPLVNGRPGRGVIALVSLPSVYTHMALNVNAGATVGSDLEVGGNSKVVDRSSACADSLGAAAVVHEAGTTVTTSGSGNISGSVQQSSLSGQAFIDWILNGKTLEEFAKLADIKFGPRLDPELFPNNARAKWDATNPKLRWGCPAGIAGVTCPTNDPQTNLYPTVGVDANGGTVNLQGDHGQGILIIFNGNLEIQGNFQYNGIVLVEGYTKITGTGGGSTTSKIEGALISLGQNTTQKTNIAESATMGNAVISYNRCQVKAAQDAFNQRQIQKPVFQAPQATFGWFELVR